MFIVLKEISNVLRQTVVNFLHSILKAREMIKVSGGNISPQLYLVSHLNNTAIRIIIAASIYNKNIIKQL